MFFNAVVMPLIAVVFMPYVYSQKSKKKKLGLIGLLLLTITIHEAVVFPENWIITSCTKLILALVMGFTYYYFFYEKRPKT